MRVGSTPERSLYGQKGRALRLGVSVETQYDKSETNNVPSTTDTMPQRFVGAMELNDGELDIGDSSVTNTRCEPAGGYRNVSGLINENETLTCDLLASSFCMV